MIYFDPEYWADHMIMAVAIVAATCVLISIFADKRRQRRVSMDQVGFMPWTAITVFSVLVAVIATALAIKLA